MKFIPVMAKLNFQQPLLQPSVQCCFCYCSLVHILNTILIYSMFILILVNVLLNCLCGLSFYFINVFIINFYLM